MHKDIIVEEIAKAMAGSFRFERIGALLFAAEDVVEHLDRIGLQIVPLLSDVTDKAILEDFRKRVIRDAIASGAVRLNDAAIEAQNKRLANAQG